MPSLPLVSCVMPTRNRRYFAFQAIWYFLCQDFPNKELIIVDDGSDPIMDIIPQDDRLHYIHLKRETLLGDKYRLAVERSNGEFIAHWDDDDWHSSKRLSAQVNALIEQKRDISVIRQVLTYHLQLGTVWLPKYRSYIHPGTFVYSRQLYSSFFANCPSFNTPDLLNSQLDNLPVAEIESSNYYIAIMHEQNTRSPVPSNHLWQQQPLAQIESLLYADQDFYIALRNGGNIHRTVDSDDPALTLVAPIMTYDGYGSMAEYLALGIEREGVNINIEPLAIDRRGLSDQFCKLVDKSHIRPYDPVLYFCWSNGELDRFTNNPNLFINTMWESSSLPSGWVEKINNAQAVIVPTQFVARIFRENGVLPPIHVIPEGIDPQVYTFIPRPQRENITTLIVGTLIERKHWREAVMAWQLAFEDDPQATLLIKSRFGHHSEIPDDPRIQFVDENEATRGIAHWYAQADVLLALGSEGFGLPLVEGMATGLPVIALNAEGQADVCAEAAGHLLPVSPSHYAPYVDDRFGSCGEFAIPNVEEAANHLHWVATHREEAYKLGKGASTWAQKHRNIWDKAPAILDIIENNGEAKRTLRWLPTLWLPSWESHCGIAEYTHSLVNESPRVRVLKHYEESQPIQLLHVQHQHSLFDNSDLLERLTRTKMRHKPVIVSEHSIGEHVEPWERHADALIALTSKGASQLKQRWPQKDIRHIPIGAPTWFPERKKKRQKVIGAFGFLEPHKGFWQLLNVLKKHPDLSLRLFSHAQSGGLLDKWREDSKDLPVHHVTEYLSTEDIAARLASETDIIVYWYDEVPFYSASAAVRVGLASGVPVLTSQTSWFHDLQGVTYQPENLCTGIQHLLGDTTLRHRLTEAAEDYCHATTWEKVAKQHQELWSDYRR